MIRISGLHLITTFKLLFVLSKVGGVVWSKMIRTGFCRIMLMELFNDFFSVSEIGSGEPLIFFVSTFISHPVDIIEQFAAGPESEVILGVKDFTDFIFDFAFYFYWFRRWRLLVRETIFYGRLDLQDMEDGMNEVEFMRETETNGVLSDVVNNFKRTKVWFSKFTSWAGCLDILGDKENPIAGFEVWWRNSSLVGRYLIMLLSELEGFC